jgi:O-antigen ligase
VVRDVVTLTRRPGERAAVLGACVVGLALAATLRQGAFYPLTAELVTVVALGLVVAAAVALRPTGRSLAVVGASGLVALWWLVRAATIHDLTSFVPLGAGMVCFGCASMIAAGLSRTERVAAAQALVATGALSGGVGLIGVLFRWSPEAIPSQHLWRLATTLTYSNAAGALLALSVVVAFALDADRMPIRLAMYLCTASLLATQSRGAVLGAVIALCFVPATRLRRFAVPLGMGLVGGLVAVAASPGAPSRPLALIGLVVPGAAAAALWRVPRRADISRQGRLMAVAGLVAVVALSAVAAATVLSAPITRRLQLASTQDRNVEWSAAYHQWLSSPWIGTGPDRLLHFKAVDGNIAHFAHNEYLQILAGGGVVGALLLAVLIVCVVRAVRRHDVLASCAVGALVAFACSAGLDFDWHLPALCLWAGLVSGLATPLPVLVPTPGPGAASQRGGRSSSIQASG